MPLGPANSTKLLTNSKTILYFINLLFVRKQSKGNDNVIIMIFSTHYLKFSSITDSFGHLFYLNAKILNALQWKDTTSIILLSKKIRIREEILKYSFLHINNHTIALDFKKTWDLKMQNFKTFYAVISIIFWIFLSSSASGWYTLI